MAVQVQATPNPNAVKLAVGRPVGGPKTFVAGTEVDDPVAAALLGIPGVKSVFMTADFVTITKSPDAEWDPIVTAAVAALEQAYA